MQQHRSEDPFVNPRMTSLFHENHSGLPILHAYRALEGRKAFSRRSRGGSANYVPPAVASSLESRSCVIRRVNLFHSLTGS